MSEINPFELLGVTVKSTPKDVQNAYHALALIMHPDKGGNKSEMIVLMNAYNYVMKQVKWANFSSSDQALSDADAVKRLEQTFSEFCREQELEREKNNEVTNNEHFNRMWFASKNPVWSSAYHGGYPTSRTDALPSLSYAYDPNNAFDELIEQISSELIVYKEPQPFNHGIDINISHKDVSKDLDDYGSGDGLSDYKKAYCATPLKDFRTIQDTLPEKLVYVADNFLPLVDNTVSP